MARKKDIPRNFLIGVVVCTVLVLLTVVFVTRDDGDITAWASLQKQIKPFADECEAQDGIVVVQKVKSSDDREFTCTYPDGTQTIYTFSKR